MNRPSNPSPIVFWLRAAGEPTRLRLLALCEERDVSVSDLAAAIGQSEPRVSRHLKILSEAGLIEGLRQGQWVHYQITRTGPVAAFMQGLLAQIDRTEAPYVGDRLRVPRTPAREISAPVSGGSRLGFALRDLMEASHGETAAGGALVVGAERPQLLAGAAALARECTALAPSRRAAQQLRAFADREGFKCRVLLAPQSESLSERALAGAGAPFDLIVLDRIAGGGGALKAALIAVRSALAPQGRLWLLEDYEALEGGSERVIEHPLSRLRRLLSETGFACDRLSPIEADGEHVLAAAAVALENFNTRVA